MISVNNKEIDNKEIEFNNKEIDNNNKEIDNNNIEIGNDNVDEMTDTEISIDNIEFIIIDFINKSKRERVDNKINMADIEISIRENNYKELISNKELIDVIINKWIHIGSDTILEHIINNRSGNNNNNHFSNNNLEKRSNNNLFIIIGHKSLLVNNDLLVIIDRNTNFCFTIIKALLKINFKHCTTCIFNKHFAENILIKSIEREVINDNDLNDNNINKREEKAAKNCINNMLNIIIGESINIDTVINNLHFATTILIINILIADICIFNCNDYFFSIYDSTLSISSISSSNSRSRLSSNSSRSSSSSRSNNIHHEDNRDKDNDNDNDRGYNNINFHNRDNIDIYINDRERIININFSNQIHVNIYHHIRKYINIYHRNREYINIFRHIIDYINIYVNIPEHDYNNYINNRGCFNIHFNIDKYINYNFDIVISIFLYLVINNEITNHININIEIDNDNNNDNDNIHNNHYIDNIVYKHNIQYIVIVIVIFNNIIENNLLYNNVIINENNLDNNYLASSSQSTLIINTVSTTATTQVNNDFCNICENIGETTTFSYHNLIRRYDNKVCSSIGNIIRSERYKAIVATTNIDYLNVILVERFDTIGATVNDSYLSLIVFEGFSTNGATGKTSYNGVIGKKKRNSNGETTNENNGFIVDIVFIRWCDGQSAITPRGGVNKQRPLLLWLKLHKRSAAPEAAATLQRQQWWQSYTT